MIDIEVILVIFVWTFLKLKSPTQSFFCYDYTTMVAVLDVAASPFIQICVYQMTWWSTKNCSLIWQAVHEKNQDGHHGSHIDCFDVTI